MNHDLDNCKEKWSKLKEFLTFGMIAELGIELESSAISSFPEDSIDSDFVQDE